MNCQTKEFRIILLKKFSELKEHTHDKRATKIGKLFKNQPTTINPKAEKYSK